MVKIEEIEELIRLLEDLRNDINRINRLESLNWKERVITPLIGEEVEIKIDEAKKNELKAKLNEKLKNLVNKISKIDFSKIE